MKILAVVESSHQGNTRKIAEAMATVAPMTITDIAGAKDYDFDDFDIVGFGSGIYAGMPDRKIVKLLKNVCEEEKYSFVFSTSGTGKDSYNNTLIKLLESKNKVVLGSFACKGLDKFFILKLMGGMNKGKPDEDDFKAARMFILDVMKKYEVVK